MFASYPLRRSFARLGLTYGFDISNIKTLTTAASTYFNYIDFEGVGGPNQLSGIRTSKITPSYTYNTVNNPITPTGGRSLFFSAAFAGSVLGGNVNTMEPTIDAKYFRHGFEKGHVIGMHLLARMITGYGGKVAPPFARFYTGGENDIRGFDIWGISPIVYPAHRRRDRECLQQRWNPARAKADRQWRPDVCTRDHVDSLLSARFPGRRHQHCG